MKLTVYCPLNLKLIDFALKNNFHKHSINFNENIIFNIFKKKVINFLKRQRREIIVKEGVRFYYEYLVGQPTRHINDYNFYGELTDFFISRKVFNRIPKYVKCRNVRNYAVLVYKNDKFYFIRIFSSLIEMEEFFGIKININKKHYLIKYK